MRRFLVLLGVSLLAFVVGCPAQRSTLETEEESPPLVAKGDQVALKQGNQVGLVLKVFHKKIGSGPDTKYLPGWHVTVLFRDKELDYPEDHLRVIERMDWNKPISKGEIEPGKPVKSDP